MWSRADLTVAIAARIDTLTEPAQTTAAAMTTLVEQLTDIALTPQPATAAMTAAMTPTGVPLTDAMTPADPTEHAAASSASAFASSPAFGSSPPALASSGSVFASSGSGSRRHRARLRRHRYRRRRCRRCRSPATWVGCPGSCQCPDSALSMPPSVLSMPPSEVSVDMGVVGLGPIRCGDTARASDAHYASRELVQMEARIIERTLTGSVCRPRPLPARLHRLTATGPCGIHLTGEQQRAVLLLAASEDLVTVLTAPAGRVRPRPWPPPSPSGRPAPAPSSPWRPQRGPRPNSPTRPAPTGTPWRPGSPATATTRPSGPGSADCAPAR